MAANRDPLSGKRLDSWKEIAAFFGRAERTVKRWETERGLPVHRVPGGGRSAVFAYPNELADWLKGAGQEIDGDDSGEVNDRKTDLPRPAMPAAAAPPAVAAGIRSWPFSRLAAWIVPLLLVGGLITYFSIGHSDPRFKALAGRHPSNADASNLYLSPDSVAVLPFTNEGGNAATDYLSDGITESLIGNLAHVPQLKVRSRDSVFRYKGKDVEVRTIGSNLGVSVVVSGRVLVQGDTIAISAELTDIRDNTEIWGHRYTGNSANLISLQQQIAGDIATKLRSTLSSSERQHVMRQGTQNAEAYELYLKGRYAWNRRTRPDLEAAISYFNQAIDKDPEYALAYSGLADTYSVLPFFATNPREDYPRSNAAARKALELDPTLAHPHAVLGSNEMQYDWDFEGGEAEFKKAIELDPNDATAHQWYAEALSGLGGRDQQALTEINLAHQLDPQSLIITRVVAGVLVGAGRYDEAIAICKQLAVENPTFAVAHDCLAYAYWDKHMYPEVIQEWEAYGRLTGNPDDAEYAAAMEQGFRSGGWRGACVKAIEDLEQQRKTGYASPFIIARLYADLGNTDPRDADPRDKEQAFRWLDTAYSEHDSLLVALRSWPQFNSMRSDPRFTALERKIGLPK